MDSLYASNHFLTIILVVSTLFVSCFSTHKHDNPKANTLVNVKNTMQEMMISRGKVLLEANSASSRRKIVNVHSFGAKANGNDDSQAFLKAWNEACSSNQGATMVVPRNKIYHLKPVTFSGPCNSDLILEIFGTIKASVNLKDYEKNKRNWIVFQNVDKFRVRGGGTIDGNGKVWWQKSCKVNKNLPCEAAPTAVTFNKCKGLIVSNLRFRDAQKMHLTIKKCVNVRVTELMVTAPEKSPNTDGIHVTGTQNIRISKSVIRTGDDCISIVSGSKNVEAADIICGPGHGISIGSLGAGNAEAQVSNVMVDRATISGTTNGVRIKTWQGGSGYARNMVFQNVVMKNVSNPIIITQNYCDQVKPCHAQKSAVQVSNVVYRNIRGTSASEVAVKFDCSKTYPCKGIVLQNVDLRDGGSRKSKASCENVDLAKKVNVSPSC